MKVMNLFIFIDIKKLFWQKHVAKTVSQNA